MVRATRSQSLGRMLVESMFMACFTSSVARSATPGTYLVSSSPESAGDKPFPSSFDAMVPPVATSKMRFFVMVAPQSFAYRARFWLLLDGRREQGTPRDAFVPKPSFELAFAPFSNMVF